MIKTLKQQTKVLGPKIAFHVTDTFLRVRLASDIIHVCNGVYGYRT
jgi:hypothetical protein